MSDVEGRTTVSSVETTSVRAATVSSVGTPEVQSRTGTPEVQSRTGTPVENTSPGAPQENSLRNSTSTSNLLLRTLDGAPSSEHGLSDSVATTEKGAELQQHHQQGTSSISSSSTSPIPNLEYHAGGGSFSSSSQHSVGVVLGGGLQQHNNMTATPLFEVGIDMPSSIDSVSQQEEERTTSHDHIEVALIGDSEACVKDHLFDKTAENASGSSTINSSEHLSTHMAKHNEKDSNSTEVSVHSILGSSNHQPRVVPGQTGLCRMMFRFWFGSSLNPNEDNQNCASAEHLLQKRSEGESGGNENEAGGGRVARRWKWIRCPTRRGRMSPGSKVESASIECMNEAGCAPGHRARCFLAGLVLPEDRRDTGVVDEGRLGAWGRSNVHGGDEDHDHTQREGGGGFVSVVAQPQIIGAGGSAGQVENVEEQFPMMFGTFKQISARTLAADAFEIGANMDNVYIPSLTPTFFLCRNPLTVVRNICRFIKDNAIRSDLEFVPILKRRRVLKTRHSDSTTEIKGVTGGIMGGSRCSGTESGDDEEEEVVEGIIMCAKMFCFGMPLLRKSYGFGPREGDIEDAGPTAANNFHDKHENLSGNHLRQTKGVLRRKITTTGAGEVGVGGRSGGTTSRRNSTRTGGFTRSSTSSASTSAELRSAAGGGEGTSGGAIWHPVLRDQSHGTDETATSVLGDFSFHAMFDEPSVPDVFRFYTCHKHFILTHSFRMYDDPEYSKNLAQGRLPSVFLKNRMVLYSKNRLKPRLSTETWFSRDFEEEETSKSGEQVTERGGGGGQI